MKHLLIVGIFLSVVLSVNGQSTDITTLFMSDWQKAEIHYQKWAFKNAIELYERALDKNPNDFRAKIRIAECYAELNELDKAVNWYRQIIDYEGLDPIHYYNFAQSLSMIGNYEEAEMWYKAYMELNPEDTRPARKLLFSDQMELYRHDTSLCQVINFPQNSENSDFGIVSYKDGFIFLSARDEDLFIKYKDSYQSSLDDVDNYESRLDLYYTSFKASTFSKPEKLQDINTRFHEGPLAFYQGNNKVIFTRNNYFERKKKVSKDGRLNLKLFIGERSESDHWVNITPFPYNDDEYSSGHPSLGQNDQILFFASDRPGGYGGSDIYYCIWENGQWGLPINLGSEINTEGEELFPFYSFDGNLYFASDGHGGFGGLDTYRSYPIGSSFGNVENLGSPINSSKDDFAFSLNPDGRTGFISSNRNGGVGSDDIYEFNIKFLGVVGRVVESTSKELIADAKVIVTDELTNMTYQRVSNEKGIFRLDVPIDSKYYLVAEKEGYSQDGLTHLSSDINKFETDSVDVWMWKHLLFAEGRVFSNETHELMDGVTISIENLTDDKHVELVTDQNGSYFYVLRPDRIYEISADASDHISANFTLNTKAMVADTLRNDFLLEETFLDKSTVFFDFDSEIIKESAMPTLNEMVNVMKKYRDTYIVISAHADAQGTFEYNKKLSDRRALSVVKYLKSRGIQEDRIDWYGFGEELLLNKCSDGVECEEDDHSLNRRAELKIEDPNTKDTQGI